MSNAGPSTPVRVPGSAANYTPATLDPDLRSQINTLLWRDGHVTKIQDHLLHALHANSHNWPTLVQAHALSLLRSGEITSFPALLKRVMDDVRQDTAQASSGAANPSPHLVSNATLAKTGGGAANAAGGGAGKGMEGVNGNGNGNGNKVNGDADGGESGTAGQSLALPPAVVAEALRIARESLEMVCEVEENGAT